MGALAESKYGGTYTFLGGSAGVANILEGAMNAGGYVDELLNEYQIWAAF